MEELFSDKLYAVRNGSDIYEGASLLRMNRDGSGIESVLEVGLGDLIVEFVTSDGTVYMTMWRDLYSDAPTYGVYTMRVHDGVPELLYPADTYTHTIFVDFGVPGDANGDRRVDVEDFSILKAHFGSGSRRSQGDFNGDHAVDLVDFQILKSGFGPPASAALAVTGVAGIYLASIARRQRERRRLRCGIQIDPASRSRSS